MRAAAALLSLAAAALAAGCGNSAAPARPSAHVRAPGFPRAAGVSVPRGFRAEIYATGLRRPTAVAYGPDRRLYVAENGGRIVVTGPGSRRPRLFAGGFPVPLGLAWKGRALYVSRRGALERVLLRHGRAVDRATVVGRLPYGLHQQDNVVVGPNGRLYFGSGSTCDACREHDRRSATILSVRPNGSGLEVVATGLRNPFGLAVQPRTGAIYASVNGRDRLGSAEPAEMVVRIRNGDRFGWPDCWPDARTLRMVGSCRGVAAPAAYLEPHSSADGLVFYTGSSFPHAYRGNLFVAEWGQYYGHRFGRRVVRVRLARNGAASRVSVFASGISHPLAVAVDPRGALLVADWQSGVIYRIQRAGRP